MNEIIKPEDFEEHEKKRFIESNTNMLMESIGEHLKNLFLVKFHLHTIGEMGMQDSFIKDCKAVILKRIEMEKETPYWIMRERK